MKFTLNGALTIGTLDGANVEIREEVGEENFFLFGLRTEELAEMHGATILVSATRRIAELKKAIDQIHGGHFSPATPDLFHPVTDPLLKYDTYFVLGDYASYIECQEEVSRVYRDETRGPARPFSMSRGQASFRATGRFGSMG